MATIEEVSIEMAELLKTVRLRALKDMPSAFGSTFAGESQLTDEDWRRRAATWNGERSVCFLAMEDGLPCGIVAGKLIDGVEASGEAGEARFAEVMSMWVAAEQRGDSSTGKGLAARLVNAVEQWARRLGAGWLRLTVTSSNARAIGFYRKCGFEMTGRTEPYPNDVALVEFEMVKPLLPA